MSNRAMSWAIEIRTLPIATKAVLMLLADCHNGSTGQCHPSMEWLMDRTGLKARALQMHLKALEEAGLIERQYTFHGRGKGCSIEQYTLKIGIMGAVKKPEMETQDIAPAKECARKITSMDTQNIAPPYKEEPEENRKSKGRNEVSPDFETAWKLYQSCPNKALRQKKKLAREQWARTTRKAAPDRLLKAIQTEIETRASADGFVPALPDMFRWLRDETWMDVERDSAPQPTEELSIDAWRQVMRGFVEHGSWPGFLGPKPGEPDCRVPAGMILHWQRIQAQENAA